MTAKELFHDAVIVELEKEGWTITQNPLYLKIGTAIELYIDLAAEKLIAAEKENHKIAVEIKSFTAPSILSDFHLAVGQFTNYRYALEEIEPDRDLYLAIPVNTYKNSSKLPLLNLSFNVVKLI